VQAKEEKMRIRNILVVAALVFMITNVSTMRADEKDKKYGASCKRPQPDTWLEEQRKALRDEEKLSGKPLPAFVDYRPSACTTDLTKKIEVTCERGYFLFYDCTAVKKDGQAALSCKDVVQKDLPPKILTEEEFSNTPTRCTTLCGSCETGWK
jgi:hypothetical protein